MRPFRKTLPHQPDRWPFPDPGNTAVITLRRIVNARAPILAVWHNADDGTWQFLDGSDELDMDEAAVVALQEIVRLDPSILELADLPTGWVVWRPNPSSPWKRRPET